MLCRSLRFHITTATLKLKAHIKMYNILWIQTYNFLMRIHVPHYLDPEFFILVNKVRKVSITLVLHFQEKCLT